MSHLTFTEKYTTYTLTSPGSWIDKTLSGVPGNSLCVFLICRTEEGSNDSGCYAGVGDPGTTTGREIYLHVPESGGSTTGIIYHTCDASSQVSMFCTWDVVDVILLGYFESSVEKVTGGADNTDSTGFDEWSTVHGGPTNGVMLCHGYHSVEAAEQIFGVREVGSSLNRTIEPHECEGTGNVYISHMVNIQNNQYEVYRGSTDIDIESEGSLSPNIGFIERWDTLSMSSDGTWATQTANDVGKGCVAIVACLGESSGTEEYMGSRALGSSLERKWLQEEAESGGLTGQCIPVQVDSNGYYQTFFGDVSDSLFKCIGFLYKISLVSLETANDFNFETDDTPTLEFTAVEETGFSASFELSVDNSELFDSEVGDFEAYGIYSTYTWGFCIDPDTHDLYLADKTSDTTGGVYRVAAGTTTKIDISPFVSDYTAIAFDSGTGNLYVAVGTPNSIWKYDGSTWTDLDPIGYSWGGLAVNPTNGDVWAIASSSYGVYKYDGSSWTSISGSGSGYSLTIDPATGDVWSGCTNGVYKYTTADGFFTQLDVSIAPIRFYRGIAFDTNTGDIWLTAGSVYAISKWTDSDARFVDMTYDGTSWNEIAIDQSTGAVWVYDDTANTICLLGTGPKINHLSETSLDFVNTTDGADTSPFDSGDKCSFTVPAADALSPGHYYWKVRSIFDETNPIWGPWSEVRIFYTGITTALNTSDEENINFAAITLEFTGTHADDTDVHYALQISQYSDIQETTDDFESWFSPSVTENLRDVAVNSSNGDVWYVDTGYNIWVNRGGLGDFVNYNVIEISWYCIAVNSANGDVWAAGYNGDIYKNEGGDGTFVAFGGTSRAWRGLAVNPDTGDVFGADQNSSIYKSDGGTGSFTALAETSGSYNWYDVDVNPTNGDVWAASASFSVAEKGLWKIAGGSGTPTRLAGSVNHRIYGMGIDQVSGDLWYSAVYSSLFFKEDGSDAIIDMGHSDWDDTYGFAINSLSKEIWVAVYDTSTGGLWKKNNGPLYEKTSNIAPLDAWANTTDGADTSPFDSGDMVSFTLETENNLILNDTYYWKARAFTEAGALGGWSSIRSFTVSEAGSIDGDAVLPLFTGTATGVNPVIGAGDTTLPLLTSACLGYNEKYTNDGEAVLPLFTGAGVSRPTAFGNGILSLLTGEATGLPPVWGDGDATLPLLTGDCVGIPPVWGDGDAELPLFVCEAGVITYGGDTELPLLECTGTATSTVYALSQNSFKFRNDNGSEITAGSKSAQNGKISLVPEAKFRLRIGLLVYGYLPTQTLQLETRIKKDGETAFGVWTKVV